MNEEINEKVVILPPFKHFIMTVGEIPTSYLESMTYYEMLVWFTNYLGKTVIPAINENGEAVIEIQNLYVELQDYVNNYFTNLDVQEEINNKLDQMATAGTLGEYFERYVQPSLDAQDQEIQSFKTSVNSEITTFKSDVNEDIQELTDRVNNVMTGSPAGVYSTVEALTSADPSHSRIYVVNADGKWYYWSTSNNTWVAGGTYQATSIGANEIKYSNLDSKLQNNIALYTMTTGNVSSEGTYYNGSVGSAITLTSLQNFVSGSFNVNEGDIIYVPFVDRANYGVVKPIILTDENDIILYTIDITDIRDSETYLPTNFTYEIPEGVHKLYFNACRYTDTNMRWYPYILGNYNYQDRRLTNQLTNKTQLNVAENKTGIYSNYYWGTTLGNYYTRVYNVNPLDKINVVTTLAASYTLLPGVFVNSDGKPVGYIGPQGGAATQEINTDVTVPASASQLYISVSGETVTTIVSKYSFSEASNQKTITANLSSNILTLTNNDNGNYIIFKHFGANSLFGFQSYKVGATTVSSSTDMSPAPYMVEAVNNGDGDRETLGFTGGCHGFDNSIYTTSNATATEESLHIYCDGVELLNGNAQCEQVKIVVVNNIQGSNTCLESGTGRSVLKEKLVFTFDGINLKVMNTISPLEAIKLSRYYGIQLTGSSNNSYKVYADKLYGNATQSSVPSKPDLIVGGVLGARMKTSGIGDYRYNSAQKVYISDNKAYFVPVRGSEISLTTNDVLYFEGEYIISDNIS